MDKGSWGPGLLTAVAGAVLFFLLVFVWVTGPGGIVAIFKNVATPVANFFFRLTSGGVA